MAGSAAESIGCDRGRRTLTQKAGPLVQLQHVWLTASRRACGQIERRIGGGAVALASCAGVDVMAVTRDGAASGRSGTLPALSAAARRRVQQILGDTENLLV